MRHLLSGAERTLGGQLLLGGLAPAALLVAGFVLAGAAPAADPIRIGALTESWGPTPVMVGLRDGLEALGHREGEQFVIGVRFTQGDPSALPAAARDLVRDGADILFTTMAGAKAAQAVTSGIPIVFAGGRGDPVQLGLVRSFARPGGNITGITDLGLELAPKRVEVFRDIVPRLRRVLVAYDATDAYGAEEVAAYRDAARRLGLSLVEKPVRSQEEARATFATLRKGDVQGILMSQAIAWNIAGFALEAASRLGLPTMFPAPFWVEQGALASYGPDYSATGRQAARLVGKILKGSKPGDIPVETNPKIEFAVNAKVFQSLGLTLRPEVLHRVDRVVQ